MNEFKMEKLFYNFMFIAFGMQKKILEIALTSLQNKFAKINGKMKKE